MDLSAFTPSGHPPRSPDELGEMLARLVEQAKALEAREGWHIPPLAPAGRTLERWRADRTRWTWLALRANSLERALRAARCGDSEHPQPGWSEPYRGSEELYIALCDEEARRRGALRAGGLLRGPYVADEEDVDGPARFARLRAFRSPELCPTELVGDWPIRLLRVAPHSGFEPGNGSCSASGFRILGEEDPHRALGPNGRAVAAIIARARRMSAGEHERMRVGWAAAREAAADAAVYERALRAARDAARDAGLEAPFRWALIQAPGGPDDPGAIVGVAAAPGVAAAATVVAHLLSPQPLAALTGPWHEAIGDPDVPGGAPTALSPPATSQVDAGTSKQN